MKIFILFQFFASMLIYSALAQEKSLQKRFSHVDKHVYSVNKQLIFHPELLAQKLSENLTNEYDIVRAFYVWIAHNIQYDLYAFLHDRESGQSVNEVLRSGKALCTGYSILFNFLCKQNKIESKIIDGYAKAYGYKKGQSFLKPNHSWNAVKIYGQWYLLDATWAKSTVFDLSRHKQVIDLDTYFLSNPENFIQTHLPEDPSWQLLDKKISLREFEKGLGKNIENYAIENYSPEDYIKLNEYDADILKYKRASEFNPRNESFNALLSFAYLYKGISITDGLWKMGFTELMDSAQILKRSFDCYMDSSWLVIKDIENENIPYTKKIMKEEINYQKGVIHYEFGSELFVKGRNSNATLQSYLAATEDFFSVAEGHFRLVSESSIYYKDAQEFLSLINDFVSRKTTK